MRVVWILILAAWLAGFPPGHIAAAPSPPGSETGDSPTRTTQFHDGEFVFVPTPTPEPDSPVFYRGSFKVPVSRAETTTQSMPTPDPSPTPAPPTVVAAVTATPSPTQVEQAAVAYVMSAAPTITPTPFVLGAEPDPRFFVGGFYLPPLTPNAIDEPDHYRGSVVEDPGGLLAPPQTNDASLPAVPYSPANPKGNVAGTTYDTLRPSYVEQSPLPAQGRAMYYNPGIMAAVYAYRLQNKEVKACPECVGYVALLRAGDLNRKVWLRWADGNIEGPFLVIDVAARHHIPLLLSRNWVVDVDYQTALRHGMNCPVPVTVLANPPLIAADAPVAQREAAFR